MAVSFIRKICACLCILINLIQSSTLPTPSCQSRLSGPRVKEMMEIKLHSNLHYCVRTIIYRYTFSTRTDERALLFVNGILKRCISILLHGTFDKLFIAVTDYGLKHLKLCHNDSSRNCVQRVMRLANKPRIRKGEIRCFWNDFHRVYSTELRLFVGRRQITIIFVSLTQYHGHWSKRQWRYCYVCGSFTIRTLIRFFRIKFIMRLYSRQ